MGILNEYIRELLEAAVAPEQAAQQGLALYVHNGMYYTLYNAQELLNDKEGHPVAKGDILPYIVAHFSLENNPSKYPCRGANAIGIASAQKGYGPMMYDILMSDSPNGLMPDRGDVSDQAQDIRNYYANNRSDIEKLPLDNGDDPQTPPKEDDCYIHGLTPEGTPLDYVYNGSQANSSGLIANHEELINNFGQDISHLIHQAGLIFAWQKLGI